MIRQANGHGLRGSSHRTKKSNDFINDDMLLSFTFHRENSPMAADGGYIVMPYERVQYIWIYIYIYISYVSILYK